MCNLCVVVDQEVVCFVFCFFRCVKLRNELQFLEKCHSTWSQMSLLALLCCVAPYFYETIWQQPI